MSVGQHQWVKVQSRPELCLVVGWPATGVQVYPGVFKAPAREKGGDELLRELARAEKPARKARTTTGGLRRFVGSDGSERRPLGVRAHGQTEVCDDDEDDTDGDDRHTTCGAASDADVDPSSLARAVAQGVALFRQL